MNKLELLLGKTLGEIYRIQKKLGIVSGASSSKIMGLLNGFENTIEDELDHLGVVTKEQLSHTIHVLDEHSKDPEKFERFTGFYDIEEELKDGGVSRGEAMLIIKYLLLDHCFEKIIKKMDSDCSPGECRTFEPFDWEK